MNRKRRISAVALACATALALAGCEPVEPEPRPVQVPEPNPDTRPLPQRTTRQTPRPEPADPKPHDDEDSYTIFVSWSPASCTVTMEIRDGSGMPRFPTREHGTFADTFFAQKGRQVYISASWKCEGLLVCVLTRNGGPMPPPAVSEHSRSSKGMVRCHNGVGY
jgi:ribonuclease I